MAYLFSQYQQIICYTDGACSSNPGLGGSGAVFTGKNKIYQDDSDLDFETESEVQNFEIINDDEEFLFGISLHLGMTSNNYAEYMGLITGQLFCGLFGVINPTFKTDS